MSRIRSVKPDFFRHEGLQDLEKENPGKYPMFVFEGLWTKCDRQGIFEWRPRLIKLDILPFLDFEMEKTLKILETAGYIQKYTVDEKEYGIIPTFKKHQGITRAEMNNINLFPLPEEGAETFGKEQQTVSEPFSNGFETDDEPVQNTGVLSTEYGNLKSEVLKSDSGNSGEFDFTDRQKIFLKIWQQNMDIFNSVSRIEKPKEWAAFWENCPYPPDDIKRRMRNFIDGVKSGAIEKRFVPATPDRFVLRGHLNTSDEQYKKPGNRGGVSPPPNLAGKKSLGGLET
jgi:hypothetical protein